MRTLRSFLVPSTFIPSVLVGALLLCLPLGAQANDDLEQEVEAIGDALAKAMVNDDFEAVSGFYAEDAISLPNFEPRMDGVEAFKAASEDRSASGMKINSFSNTPTEVWQAGDNVIEIGSFKINLDVPGMGNIDDAGKYITIYKRDADGKLKIVVETWNTDMNPMTMMGGGPASE